jgi:hypothetical protein
MGVSKPVTRAIRLVRPPDRFGVGVFCFRICEEIVFYTFREVPARSAAAASPRTGWGWGTFTTSASASQRNARANASLPETL